MVYYECQRCGYNTTLRGNMKHHLNRKNICEPILDNISIEEMKDIYNFEVKTMNPNESKMNPNESILNPNESILNPNESRMNPNESKYECIYCKKIYSTNSNMRKHEKTCKIKIEKKEIDLEKDNEIKQMKLEIENLKTKSITTNNITNNTNNNIINIRNIGDENIKHIKSKDFAVMLKGIYSAVPKLIEKIHFDPGHPENQNIKYTNKKFPYLKVMKDNKWQLVNKKNELLNLIDSNCYLLNEVKNKISEKNKYNISEFHKNNIDEFMDKYNEDDKNVMLDLMERTELMLLNNS